MSYNAGYNAYWNDMPFNNRASTEWQEGWLDAENEDNEYDYDAYYGDYDDGYSF